MRDALIQEWNNGRHALIEDGIAGAARFKDGLGFMPMLHTSGCGMITLGCLQAACRMVLVSFFDPAAIIRLIEGEKVTSIVGVPTMLVALLEYLAQNPADLSSVEMVSSGGAMVAPELVRNVRDVFGCTFQTLYGQTEASPVITL